MRAVLQRVNKSSVTVNDKIIGKIGSGLLVLLGVAKEDEILEAIEVGIEMTGGPGTTSARFAMNVLDYYLNDK